MALMMEALCTTRHCTPSSEARSRRSECVVALATKAHERAYRWQELEGGLMDSPKRVPHHQQCHVLLVCSGKNRVCSEWSGVNKDYSQAAGMHGSAGCRIESPESCSTVSLSARITWRP